MKYTKGKWVFSKYLGSKSEQEKLKKLGMEPTKNLTNDAKTLVNSEDGSAICSVHSQTDWKTGKGYNHDCEERDANARLISCTPELLALLKEWEQSIPKIDEFDDVSPESLRGRTLELIKKAEGK